MQLNLIDSFREFKDFKNFDKETMMAILEDVFRNMIIKKYGSDENFDLIINPEKGDLEIWRNREIVENESVEDENEQISLEDALRSRMTLKWVRRFQRKSYSSLSDVVRSFSSPKPCRSHHGYRERSIYQKYKERIGEVINCRGIPNLEARNSSCG